MRSTSITPSSARKKFTRPCFTSASLCEQVGHCSNINRSGLSAAVALPHHDCHRKQERGSKGGEMKEEEGGSERQRGVELLAEGLAEEAVEF